MPFSDVVAALQFQGLELDVFRPGDILLVRFGYLAQYEALGEARRDELDRRYQTEKPENIGFQPSRELLSFLWDRRLAAVASDTRALEVWPCTQFDWHMHEWLLAGWGMPIGEMFYLEELSRVCTASKRYIFFLTSSPMNVSRLAREMSLGIY